MKIGTATHRPRRGFMLLLAGKINLPGAARQSKRTVLAFMLAGESVFSWQLLNILGMAMHRPEVLSGSTLFFKETFGTFPLLKNDVNREDSVTRYASQYRPWVAE